MPHSALACLASCALLLAGNAFAQHGLKVSADPRTHQRLQLGPIQLGLSVNEPGTTPRAQLYGDYYLTGPGFGEGFIAGGLRLTSGLAIGPRHDTLNLPSTRLGEGPRGGATLRLGADADPGRVALPYLGLGYTSLSARDGWGFSADIGLGGLPPGERMRLGRSGPTAAQMEKLLNDLRLSPVMQLGVSYAF